MTRQEAIKEIFAIKEIYKSLGLEDFVSDEEHIIFCLGDKEKQHWRFYCYYSSDQKRLVKGVHKYNNLFDMDFVASIEDVLKEFDSTLAEKMLFHLDLFV